MVADDDTMGGLVRTRGRALFGYAYVVCGNREQAQDLVQDALVKTFSRVRRGFSPQDAERYVRAAILTLYLDRARRASRWTAVRHLVSSPVAAPASHSDDALDVRAALDLLTPQERACVIAFYYDDLTVAAVAAQLGLAEGTVKRYLANARGRLRGVLEHDDDGEHLTVEPTPRSTR